MARIEDIDRRLCNWARWKLGAGSGGMGFSSAGHAREGGGYGYRVAVIPTVDCEAEETDRAVQSLDEQLWRTMVLVYVGAGSMRRKASSMAISEAAMHSRVWDAHRQLEAWFTERQSAARTERRRVEMLGRNGGR